MRREALSTPRSSRARALRIPRHVGLIPDGNRRWAVARGFPKHHGYDAGLEPGQRLLAYCRTLGILEISIYGYTMENTHRALLQVEAFQEACVRFAQQALESGAALLVIGDARSSRFPPALLPYVGSRSGGDLKVNLLINYTWTWDLGEALEPMSGCASKGDVVSRLGSRGVSRIDLIVRWGGRARLSGFLPFQSAYADLHVVDTLWPDMQIAEFDTALEWYARQETTLGG